MPTSYRAHDKLYILFLMTYIPIIIFFDSIPLYPPAIVPGPLMSLHQYYKRTFNDQLIIGQPPWFRFFSLVEAFYELPVAIWAVWALSNKSPKAPAHLLVWGLVCFGTTMTCLFEFYQNALMTCWEKWSLIAMYGFYGLIFGVITADMFCRIQKSLRAVASLADKEKTR